MNITNKMTSNAFYVLSILETDLHFSTLKLRNSLFRDIKPSDFDKLDFVTDNNIIQGIFNDLRCQTQNKGSSASGHKWTGLI